MSERTNGRRASKLLVEIAHRLNPAKKTMKSGLKARASLSGKARGRNFVPQRRGVACGTFEKIVAELWAFEIRILIATLAKRVELAS
jgi:hypothetical protein